VSAGHNTTVENLGVAKPDQNGVQRAQFEYFGSLCGCLL